MAVVIVPITPSIPHFRQDTDLDNATYRFTFDWSGRESAWYMAIADINGTIIRAGIRLAPNWRILRKLRHPSRPPGELIVIDPQGLGITLDNFGDGVQLVYLDAAEVEALGGTPL